MIAIIRVESESWMSAARADNRVHPPPGIAGKEAERHADRRLR